MYAALGRTACCVSRRSLENDRPGPVRMRAEWVSQGCVGRMGGISPAAGGTAVVLFSVSGLRRNVVVQVCCRKVNTRNDGQTTRQPRKEIKKNK